MIDLDRMIDEHFRNLTQEQLLRNLEDLGIDRYIVDRSDTYAKISDVGYGYIEKIDYNPRCKSRYLFDSLDNGFTINVKLAS